MLTTDDDVILEGPTFSIAWVVGDVLETPGLDLGILDSITRRVVLDLVRDLPLEVVESEFGLSRLSSASEVMAMSTIREVQAIVAVGEQTWEPGPVTARLADAFAAVVG